MGERRRPPNVVPPAGELFQIRFGKRKLLSRHRFEKNNDDISNPVFVPSGTALCMISSPWGFTHSSLNRAFLAKSLSDLAGFLSNSVAFQNSESFRPQRCGARQDPSPLTEMDILTEVDRERSVSHGTERQAVRAQTAMSCPLPPEILDLIVDHLCVEQTTLNACPLVSKLWIPRT